MKRDPGHPRAREYLEGLAAKSRYSFTMAEAQAALGVSWPTAKVALSRLAAQKRIASPAKGFYVVIPPEYRALGCLPADQFIPDLMKRRGLPYYAGLLTAAQYHGAAHQRPQEFQVMVEAARRPIACGRVRVAFIIRKRTRNVPVQSINTPRGTVRVSTPEATALDLIGYPHHAGGLNQAASVLAELSEGLAPKALAAAAETAPVSWAQRLGYLLERVGARDKTEPLKAFVKTRARQSVPLLVGRPRDKAARDPVWKLYVNAAVEIET